MDWTKLEPYTGEAHHECLHCPPTQTVASMEMVVAVGFGIAQVTKGEELIYSEGFEEEEFRTLAEFEGMAAADPDHDWRVLLEGPLRSREYQRHGPGEWVLVASGPGFA
jgi:hypothetical protein